MSRAPQRGDAMSDETTVTKDFSRSDEVDRICDLFERDWKEGKHPRIEDYLSRMDASKRAELLRQLLAVELELRCRAGEQPRLGDYRSRFRDMPSAVQGAFALQQAARLTRDRELLSKIDRYEIRRELGRGTYGIVYLAFDGLLCRLVALKVPLVEQLASTSELTSVLHEARQAVAVDSAGIVKILDVQLEHQPPFVVMDYIEGGSLKDLLAAGPLPPERAVELLIPIAEALGHAHRSRVFHLDLKPANILLDRQGRPYVTDFGFAMRQDRRGRYVGLPTGTPAYMSPEQVRREANRYDGSSDIWSLGVIFYEMLSGNRPFEGETEEELYTAIKYASPQRPRQLDPRIPHELERICLKCVARHQAERYGTTADVVEDLRWWQRQQFDAAPARQQPKRVPSVDSAPQVRPQGLRSFSAMHAEFFLDLLPGPRDRDGLPESLSFWKQRIEATEPADAFFVGVMYGPSGCGKSSAVAAGLVPRLADWIQVIRLPCTAEETEVDLLRVLRRQFPNLTPDATLPDAFAQLRDEGRQGHPQRKLLIVLDQFEQWLHRWQSDPCSQLVDALRHCDGSRVQCLLVVRADFFHSLTSFMRLVEVPLREGANLAAVELFDKQHAQRVLELFGQAYGTLGARCTDAQRQFLRQVVDDLAEDGRVICVRLALIAEMLKYRDWTTAAWRLVGGAHGVGEAYLEETFSGASAPPTHRLHRDAAQRVLAALLPVPGVQIKGQHRSHAEMLRESGYAGRPDAFEELLAILVEDVRLIMPVEGRQVKLHEQGAPSQTSDRSAEDTRYQLTHEYLIPSIRTWLARMQQESRTGRAELLLAERTSWWSASEDRRFLPSFGEWLSIRRWTWPERWTSAQRQMMRHADRLFLRRSAWGAALSVACLLLFLGARGWLRLQDQAHESQAIVQRLRYAEVGQFSRILDDIRRAPSLRRRIQQTILEELNQEELNARSLDLRYGLLLRLALLEVAPDDAILNDVLSQLPALPVDEILALRDALPRTMHARAAAQLWPMASNAAVSRSTRTAALLALATLDPDGDGWKASANELANWIADCPPRMLDRLVAGFRPARQWLKKPLAAVAKSDDASRRLQAAIAVAEFAREDPDLLLDVALAADRSQLAEILPALGGHAAVVQQACLAEISQEARPPWPDDGEPPATTATPDALIQQVRAAGGVLAEQFVFCPLVSLDAFESLSIELQAAGYGAQRVRPVFLDGSLHLAAIWNRDRGERRFGHSLDAEQLRDLDRSLRGQGFVPCDLAVHAASPGTARDHYACLWARRENSRDVELRTQLTDKELEDRQALAAAAGWTVAALDVKTGDGAEEQFCALWERPAKPVDGGVRTSGIDFMEDLLLDFQSVPWDIAYRAEPTSVRAPEPGPLLSSATPGDWRVDTWKKQLEAVRYCRDAAHSGHWSVRLSTPDPDDVMLRQRVTVEPGKTYLLSGCVRTQDVRLHEQGSCGASLSVFSLDLHSESIVGSADWKYLSLLFSSERLAEVEVCARLGYTNSSATGTAWFDDLLLIELSAEEQAELKCQDPEFLTPQRRQRNLLQNSDFESPPAVTAWRRMPNADAQVVKGVEPVGHRESADQLAASGFRPVSVRTNHASRRDSARITSLWVRPSGDIAWRDASAQRRANAGVILASLDHWPPVLPLLAYEADPATRSYLVDRLALGQPDLPRVTALLSSTSDDGICQGLLLSLDPRPIDGAALPAMTQLKELLARRVHEAEDPGVRSAAEWLLQRWTDVPASPPPTQPNSKRGWIRAPEGHVMAVFREPSREFLMGESSEVSERSTEMPHRRRVGRPFAIATREVTVDQYRRFVQDLKQRNLNVSAVTRYNPSGDCAQTYVTWFEAAMYCRWLGERESLDPTEQCYPSLEDIGDRMALPGDALERTGYRLPTEAEWEYACRGGTRTSRFYGDGELLLPDFAWYVSNGGGRTQPVGQLKPNRFGLFDIYGNAWEWCHSQLRVYPPGYRSQVEDDVSDLTAFSWENVPLISLRGGSFADPAGELRSANRLGDQPAARNFTFGFRVARTLP